MSASRHPLFFFRDGRQADDDDNNDDDNNNSNDYINACAFLRYPNSCKIRHVSIDSAPLLGAAHSLKIQNSNLKWRAVHGRRPRSSSPENGLGSSSPTPTKSFVAVWRSAHFTFCSPLQNEKRKRRVFSFVTATSETYEYTMDETPNLCTYVGQPKSPTTFENLFGVAWEKWSQPGGRRPECFFVTKVCSR
jgi:hypothetical protein